MGVEALRKLPPLPFFIGQFSVRIFSIGLREFARDVLYLVNSKYAPTGGKKKERRSRRDDNATAPIDASTKIS
jgi:hypothetical protein